MVTFPSFHYIYWLDNIEDVKQIISYDFLHNFNCESSVWAIKTFFWILQLH
jgi:hypothetical protein